MYYAWRWNGCIVRVAGSFTEVFEVAECRPEWIVFVVSQMFDISVTCPDELNNYKHIDDYVLEHSETTFHTLVSVIVDVDLMVEMRILAYI